MSRTKSTQRRSSSSSRTSVKARTRVAYTEKSKIKVVGEPTFRDGSRYGKAFALASKAGTVGNFLKKFKPTGAETPRAVLRDFAKSGLVRYVG